MIRWSFVLTRLVIVVAVIMLLRWGLGPVARYVTSRGIQTATGAKVEIGSTEVGLFPPRILYRDLQVADPRRGREMKDTLRAETIELVIDGDALLHRRWVARDARISGLQIGAPRDTSGHFEAEPEDAAPSPSDAPSFLTRMIAATTDSLGDEATMLAENLETVRRSRQIRQRWETEYDTLVVRARDLEKQIRSIRDQTRGIDNPLRDWPQLQRTLEQARQARNELMAVRQAIDSLPEQVQSDLASLDEAKRIDLQKVANFIPSDLQNGDDFGIDMLKFAVHKQIEKIRGYLDSGRTIANYTVVPPERERVRGEDYDLGGADRLARVLVRRCEVSGVMRAAGEVYTLKGIVENLTPTPQRLQEPTVAKFQLDGPEMVRVEYARDRRHAAEVDLLTLHWPQREAKTLRLGNPREAGIEIRGGQHELWVQLRSEGDHIEGRFVSKQTGLQMTLAVDAKYADSVAVESLQSSLDAVDRIEIDANFQGQWQDLALQMHTNLGQVFRRATQDAVNDQLIASKQKLQEKVDQTHLEQTLALREWLTTQQSEARSLLASADKSIEEMSQKVMNEVGEAEVYLGKLRGAFEKKLR
ncbi:MAG: TIGR03545 family protein [Novipirellula sp. JB048]